MTTHEARMMRPLSPHAIEVLLWCHTRTEAKEDAYPGWMQTIGEFVSLGVVEKQLDSDHYWTTPLGGAWVNALCNTPIPRMVFVDEHDRIL